jgi:hypothetical protein
MSVVIAHGDTPRRSVCHDRHPRTAVRHHDRRIGATPLDTFGRHPYVHVVSEPDDVVVVVYDDVVDEPRRAPAPVLLAVALLVLVIFVVLLVALRGNGSHSTRDVTYPAIRTAPGRRVGDDRSLAEVYARKRVLRALKPGGLAARGARLKSTCTTTNPHDLGGGQSWDCDVRSPRSQTGKRVRLVVHVREDAAGGYAGQLDHSG